MYEEKLAKEAVAVGALMVPWFYIVANATTALGVRENKETIDLFVSGATFHLVAEYVGANRWYLKHSAAHFKNVRRWMDEDKTVSKEKRCGICWR
jgi:hypothetical protein